MTHSGWMWLPVLVTGLLCPVVFLSFQEDPATRAGAEPMVSGLFFALPFVVLFLVELLCATDSVTHPPRTDGALGVAIAAATALSGAVVWWLVGAMRSGYAVGQGGASDRRPRIGPAPALGARLVGVSREPLIGSECFAAR